MEQEHFLVPKSLMIKILNAFNESALKGAVGIALELNGCKSSDTEEQAAQRKSISNVKNQTQ